MYRTDNACEVPSVTFRVKYVTQYTSIHSYDYTVINHGRPLELLDIVWFVSDKYPIAVEHTEDQPTRSLRVSMMPASLTTIFVLLSSVLCTIKIIVFLTVRAPFSAKSMVYNDPFLVFTGTSRLRHTFVRLISFFERSRLSLMKDRFLAYRIHRRMISVNFHLISFLVNRQ